MPAVTSAAPESSRVSSMRSPERPFFPALEGGLVYLDSAATTLVPSPVIEAVCEVYRSGAGGVHRGVHRLAAASTASFEAARARFAEAVSVEPERVVFGRGTTEALNVIADGITRTRLRPGDEVLVSELCHHASLVAWQLRASRVGARVVLAPIDAHGVLTGDAIVERIGDRTRVVSLPHVSNVTGQVLDTAPIAAAARAHGALFVLDGSQAFRSLSIDVNALGCDAYVFGAHKAYGPNGVGVLVASSRLLDELPPLHGGGHMVLSVDDEAHVLAPSPAKHEAGSPNVEGVLGAARAVGYLQDARSRGASARLAALTDELVRGLRGYPFVRVLGSPDKRAGIVSFAIEGVHAHDAATFFDEDGVAVRAGRMCAHPFFASLGVDDALRVSLAVHTESSCLEALFASLERTYEALA